MKKGKSVFRFFRPAFALCGLLVFGMIFSGCNESDDSTTKTTWYMDADGDGYGNPNNSIQAVGQPVDYVADNSDCNDNDAGIHPGATEICGDGIDQDCNGSDLACEMTLYYKDADGDGYSDGTTQKAAAQPAGYSEYSALESVSGDCNDNDAAVHPKAVEICNDGKDNDCNGDIDCKDAACKNDASCDSSSDDDSGTLVINEIVAKDADGGNDWIEFFAVGGPVLLGNYSVVDNEPEHVPQTLPDISLSEGDFYVVEAIDSDDACQDGSVCVSFKLGSDDSVTLFKNNVQVDSLDWAEGQADKGYSFGLMPDGTGTAQTLSPTKGSANAASTDSGEAEETVDFFSEDTVEDVYITISEADWNSILDSTTDEEYHTASITYRDITLGDVAFRTKGNSSLKSVADMNSTRYSFKVDMNYYVDGQKLLGMKKINLNNNFKDPSYMRERIAYDMMRSLDIPTPRLSYVNLHINGSLHGL